MNARQRKITISVSPVVYELLAVLAGGGPTPDVSAIVEQLVDHAQQGVYRPGAWERAWLCQVFGDDWTERLIQGDPYGRHGDGSMFNRPHWMAEDITARERKER